MAIGVLALARPTFDVPYAEEMAAKAFATLDAAGIATVGPRTLLFDADAARAAAATLQAEKLDALLLLQVTFTDASMTLELAKEIKAPLSIWAFPEPRTGGRLRLNSFCGLNLAGHALGRAGVPYQYLFQAADKSIGKGLSSFSASVGATAVNTAKATPSHNEKTAAESVLADLKGRKIGLIGEHPAGFDTCRYDANTLSNLTGISVDRFALADLFSRAAQTTPAATAVRRKDVAHLKGIDAVDQAQLDKSLTLFEGLASLKSDNGLSAFAVRCWPEMFTEYGCAICGPMGMMNGSGVPAACEADVYGAVTALMMQEVAKAPSWLVDIVDMDANDGTTVFWHCGSAPASMRDPAYDAEAQIHSNRKMPLLYQFPLKPGRITIARLSQANNQPHLLVGSGEVVRAPISFTGTSGVVKLDAAMDKALHGLIGGGYEHHVAMVYGDHTGAMVALGQRLGLPVRHLA
ncbi:MAG: L-fucose/L-arabinose isomerase family protein [Beijerinckiaceae bacterium]